MKNTKIVQLIIIVFVLIVVGVGGYYGYKEIKKAVGENGVRLKDSPEHNSGKTVDTIISADELATYTHPDYGFTIKYPTNYTLGKFPEGEGEVILFQTNDPKQGFQIFVSKYEEQEPLSLELIKKQAAELKIEKEKPLSIGPEAIEGFAFDSQTESGKTHEVWFVAGEELYQCTSYIDYGAKMEEILHSITFN